MTTEMHAAFLRGINVGGKNKLPMNVLAEIFTQAGCERVQTFIQSGNVIFSANESVAEKLPRTVSAKIATGFGYEIPVILRTKRQLQSALHNNPYIPRGADEDTLHLMFLAAQPTPSQIAALDPKRSYPDEFIVVGREIYLLLPNGVAKSKLTNVHFDAKLRTVSTMRNWRTVTKMISLMNERA